MKWRQNLQRLEYITRHHKIIIDCPRQQIPSGHLYLPIPEKKVEGRSCKSASAINATSTAQTKAPRKPRQKGRTKPEPRQRKSRRLDSASLAVRAVGQAQKSRGGSGMPTWWWGSVTVSDMGGRGRIDEPARRPQPVSACRIHRQVRHTLGGGGGPFSSFSSQKFTPRIFLM